MKIIDENGKLFGKLNLIDLLVLLLVVAAAIFLVIRLGGGALTTREPTRLVYTVRVEGQTPALYEEICRQLEMAGGRDQLMAAGKLIDDAYVIGVTAEPHVNFYADDNGVITTSIEQGEGARLDLTFTVEAYVDDPVTSQVGTQEVRVAKGHILKTTHFEFGYTTIVSCDWDDQTPPKGGRS